MYKSAGDANNEAQSKCERYLRIESELRAVESSGYPGQADNDI